MQRVCVRVTTHQLTKESKTKIQKSFSNIKYHFHFYSYVQTRTTIHKVLISVACWTTWLTTNNKYTTLLQVDAIVAWLQVCERQTKYSRVTLGSHVWDRGLQVVILPEARAPTTSLLVQVRAEKKLMGLWIMEARKKKNHFERKMRWKRTSRTSAYMPR